LYNAKLLDCIKWGIFKEVCCMTTTRIKVRGYHEDRFGHVNNARYLEFLEEARWAHLEEHGVDGTFLEQNGIFPVVVRLSLSYRRPASAGDVLEVTTKAEKAGSRRVVIGQEVRFTTSKEICVQAEVTAVFVGANTGRPVPLGDGILTHWPELAT